MTKCLIQFIQQIMMSGNVMKEWNYGDLESYSFDDFYDKNDSPIHDEEGFGIQLSADHIPFHINHEQNPVKIEQHDSEHPLPDRDIEDHFFLKEGTTPSEQTYEAQEDPPIPPQENLNGQGKGGKKKEKKIRKQATQRKNQYDKNIFANINAVILKKICAPESEPEIRAYCQFQRVSFEDFYAYFLHLQRVKFRMGTTELSNFYNGEVEGGWKQVFGMFCVRFLREEYLQYVLREGRMQEKEKYLRCATKMMYIPRLRQEEYLIISCLVNKVLDI